MVKKDILDTQLTIKLCKFESKKFDSFIDKLKPYQTDADQATISVNELKGIIPNHLEKGILGTIVLDNNQRYIGFYDGTVFVSDVKTHTDTLINISVSGDFNPSWWFDHEIPITPEISLDHLMLAAFKYYKQALNKII